MEHESRNEVLLVGRLSVPPEERELPSGDLIVTFRLVVDRPAPRRDEPASRATVDALDCVVRGRGLRRTTLGWDPGDVVEVQGALRRRFWRAPNGASSRHEVEVLRARRVAKAA
jgi:single-strand DNA-binding protein